MQMETFDMSAPCSTTPRPQSSATFVILSLNMCRVHRCNVSPACLDKCQFEVLLDKVNYGITYHGGENPDVALFTCTSFKARL